MKRIALGLFMGGMALCAANAAEVRAVASKGYVDSIAGSLSLLSTRDKTSLVAAINELFSGFDAFLTNRTQTIDANSTATQYPSAKAVYDTAIVPLNNKEDKSNKIQEIDDNNRESQVLYPSVRAVDAAISTAVSPLEERVYKTQTIDENSTKAQYPSAKAVYDTAIVPLNNKEDKSNKTQTIDENSTAEQYPSAKAVWGKFDALDYTTAGNGPTEGLEIGHAYISRLDQVNGKIKATQQRWTDIFYPNTDGGGTIRDPDSFTGIEGRIPASAADIVGALMVLRGEIPSLDGVETTSNMTQTVNASSTATQYPSAKAVYTAVNAKQDKSTADYQVGKADGTWQTLTDAEKAALQSGVTTSTVSQVATNTTELGNKLNVDQGGENGHKVMVTDETGKIIPAPLEACSDERSKCVLTFGVRADGAVGYEWEVIAR